MGEVYRAEQRTPIRREVALKLIKLGMHNKQIIRTSPKSSTPVPTKAVDPIL